MCNISSVPLPESRPAEERNVDVYMNTSVCIRICMCAGVKLIVGAPPRIGVYKHVHVHADSSKVGRCSVPRLETMTSQEVFRQVPEHIPIRRTKFAILGVAFVQSIIV